MRIALAAALLGLCIAVIGCDGEGSAKNAGRKLDEAGENVGKAVENVGEAIQEATKPTSSPTPSPK
jgi:hypothetical protein